MKIECTTVDHNPILKQLDPLMSVSLSKQHINVNLIFSSRSIETSPLTIFL